MRFMAAAFLSVILLCGCVNKPAEMLGGCVRGSGNTVAQPRNLMPFTSVEATGPITVYVTSGEASAVTVEAEDNIAGLVKARVEGDRLILGVDEKSCVLEMKPINVKVSARRINALSAAASAHILTENELNADELRLTASESGRIDASAKAAKVRTSATSAGAVNVGGSASSHEAYAASKGRITGYNLLADDADATAETSGYVEAYAAKTLKARAETGGIVRHRGGAEVGKMEATGGLVAATD